jgi:hypothetical protein
LRDLTQPGALPLRPLTLGELLDAAVVLLRTRAGRLLALGAVLALAEQALLFPLRRAANVDVTFLPGDGLLYEFGILVVVGLATEAFCITLLGGVAARYGPRALLGPAAPATPAPRTASVLTVATLAGLVCAGAGWPFLVFPVPLQIVGLVFAALLTALAWPIGYGLLGLAAPAVVVDAVGPGRAPVRSMRLATRGLRAASTRVLGYLAWLVIRLGLGGAALAAVELFYSSPSATVDNVLMGAAWLLVNSLAYPMLGCLDAALHLDARMRTEGLDIALRRTVRRGVASDDALAVPRAVPVP